VLRATLWLGCALSGRVWASGCRDTDRKRLDRREPKRQSTVLNRQHNGLGIRYRRRAHRCVTHRHRHRSCRGRRQTKGQQQQMAALCTRPMRWQGLTSRRQDTWPSHGLFAQAGSVQSAAGRIWCIRHCASQRCAARQPPPPKKTQRPLGAGGFALNRGRLATPECLGACTVRSIHRAHPSGASIGGTHASVQMRPRGFSCAALMEEKCSKGGGVGEEDGPTEAP
jgi:hypothetical protein